MQSIYKILQKSKLFEAWMTNRRAKDSWFDEKINICMYNVNLSKNPEIFKPIVEIGLWQITKVNQLKYGINKYFSM